MPDAPPPKQESEGDSLPFVMFVPNMITTLGLCLGLTAIRFVMSGQFQIAVWLILFAVVIDGLDGLIARRLRATSDFGAQLDSLSDFLNFGVVPGLLVYQMALASSERSSGWVFVLVYVICCCMRLARFNVDMARAASGNEEKPRHFTGVPAPAGALMALLPIFIRFETGIDLASYPMAVEFYLAAVGLLMVSRLPTFSPKSIRIPRENAAWILIALALFVGIFLAQFWMTLIVLDLAYAVSLPVLLIRSSVEKRKSPPEDARDKEHGGPEND